MKTFKQLAEAIKKTTGKNQFEFHGTEVKDEKKEVKEHVEQIDETAKVETHKYSWGTMKTVHHGHDFSVPLHPEHHRAIHALKDQQEHKFKDETGRHWTAKRDGEHVHLHSANNGPKTKIKHSDLKEEKDTVVKDKNGKLISFKHEGDWKKANPKKNPEGKVHNLAGQALKKAQNLNKEEVELEEGYVVRYHNPKSEKHGSEKHFDNQESADKHAARGNSVDKIGGKYTVHKTNVKGHDVKEHVELDEAAANYDASSKAHQAARKSVKGMKSTMKAEYHKDGSASIHTKSSGAISSTRAVDHHHDQAGLGYNRSESDYKSHTAKDKGGLTHTTKATPTGHTIHIHESAPVAPVPDRKYIKGTPEWKAHKEKSKPRTGHPTNVKEASFDDEGNLIAEKKSYTEFLSLLEYETDKNGKYVHKGNYGTSYKDPEGADDADDKQPKKVGRKVGSKVGPKANLGNSKLHQGK